MKLHSKQNSGIAIGFYDEVCFKGFYKLEKSVDETFMEEHEEFLKILDNKEAEEELHMNLHFDLDEEEEYAISFISAEALG